MMSISATRIGAVIRKELTEFRRNRSVVSTMGIIPVVFLVAPTADILAQNPATPSASLDRGVGFLLLYLLLIPALIPAVGIAYLVLGIFLAIVQFGASPVMAAAVWHSPELLAEVLFIPLLAGWAIWIGQAISSKASDIRVAQQLGTLAGLPPIALTLLMSFQVIHSTLILAASLAGVLLVIDCAAYLLVSKLFDRERLVTGTKPSSGRTGIG